MQVYVALLELHAGECEEHIIIGVYYSKDIALREVLKAEFNKNKGDEGEFIMNKEYESLAHELETTNLDDEFIVRWHRERLEQLKQSSYEGYYWKIETTTLNTTRPPLTTTTTASSPTTTTRTLFDLLAIQDYWNIKDDDYVETEEDRVKMDCHEAIK